MHQANDIQELNKTIESLTVAISMLVDKVDGIQRTMKEMPTLENAGLTTLVKSVLKEMLQPATGEIVLSKKEILNRDVQLIRAKFRKDLIKKHGKTYRVNTAN